MGMGDLQNRIAASRVSHSAEHSCKTIAEDGGVICRIGWWTHLQKWFMSGRM